MDSDEHKRLLKRMSDRKLNKHIHAIRNMLNTPPIFLNDGGAYLRRLYKEALEELQERQQGAGMVGGSGRGPKSTFIVGADNPDDADDPDDAEYSDDNGLRDDFDAIFPMNNNTMNIVPNEMTRRNYDIPSLRQYVDRCLQYQFITQNEYNAAIQLLTNFHNGLRHDFDLMFVSNNGQLTLNPFEVHRLQYSLSDLAGLLGPLKQMKAIEGSVWNAAQVLIKQMKRIYDDNKVPYDTVI
jgi:hypothetical protein